jgi:hypothetical protein
MYIGHPCFKFHTYHLTFNFLVWIRRSESVWIRYFRVDELSCQAVNRVRPSFVFGLAGKTCSSSRRPLTGPTSDWIGHGLGRQRRLSPYASWWQQGHSWAQAGEPRAAPRRQLGRDRERRPLRQGVNSVERRFPGASHVDRAVHLPPVLAAGPSSHPPLALAHENRRADATTSCRAAFAPCSSDKNRYLSWLDYIATIRLRFGKSIGHGFVLLYVGCQVFLRERIRYRVGCLPFFRWVRELLERNERGRRAKVFWRIITTDPNFICRD